MISRRSFTGLTVACALAIWSCGGGSSLQGTYHGPEGAVVIELRSGSAASVQFMGESTKCTYDSTSEHVMLQCPGLNELIKTSVDTLTRNQDGTFTSEIGVFAKRASS